MVAHLAELREHSEDVAAVVDVGMEYNANSGLSKTSGEYTTDISLILFDKQVRKIGVPAGKTTERGERDNAEDNVKAEKKSRASAFRMLNTSLDRLVQK